MSRELDKLFNESKEYSGRNIKIISGMADGADSLAIRYADERKLKQYRWITTDFVEDIATNVLILECMISLEHPSLIVGTSMGGVTVLYANAPNVVKIVCNPALSIADSVRNTIGLGQHEYFCDRINGKQTFELSEEMCLGYENYIATHIPSQGKENYAIFSTHDELLGDEASHKAQRVVSDAGYCVSIDSKGVHRITSSTIKLISKIVDKE